MIVGASMALLMACHVPTSNLSAPGTTGSIAGHARYAAQASSAGIVVSVEATEGAVSNSVRSLLAGKAGARTIAAQASTGDDGSYVLKDLAPGTYTVYASSKDSLEKAVTTAVAVVAGNSVTASDLNLTPVGSISGKATLNGAASGNLGILVYIAGTSYSAMTNDSGAFTISSVPATTGYLLVASKDGYDSTTKSVDVAPGSAAAVGTMNLTVHTAMATGAISGSVVSTGQASQAGVFVSLPGTPFLTLTDAAGAYVLSGIPLGKYSVEADRIGFARATIANITVTAGTTSAPVITLVPTGQSNSFVLSLNAGGFTLFSHIVPTSDGNYAISALNVTTSTDAWLGKMRPDGSFLWQVAIGTSSSDVLNDIAPTADGGLVAAGWTSSTGGGDGWIVRLSATGTVVWQETLGGPLNDSFGAITATSDGGFAIGGRTGSFSAGGTQDGWIIKISASGVVQWQKMIGGSGLDEVYSLAQLSPSGDLVFVGRYTNYTTAWIGRLDANGNSLKELSTVEWLPSTVIPTANDGVLAGGAMTLNNVGAAVADFTSPLSNTGGLGVPVYQMDNSGIQSITAMAPMSDGGYLETGTLGADGWVGRTTGPLAKLFWQKTYGGSGSHGINDLVATDDGGFIAVGYAATADLTIYQGWILNLRADGTPVDIRSGLYLGVDTFISNGMRNGFAVADVTVPSSTTFAEPAATAVVPVDISSTDVITRLYP